ncbi:MAG: hypothetical protein CV088_06465 [Nitrospira sp. LK70]|nr:hypothetical protein [Nitrospira sp. LK70]
MYSLWPWVKCRVGVATVTVVLGSTGIISSTATDKSYAGDTAPPPGVVAADIEYDGRITVGGDPVTVKISTPNKKGVMTFPGTAGQRINLGFSGVTLTQFQVSVYGPDGGLIARQPTAVRNYYATMGERPLSSQTQVLTSMTAYQFTADSGATISSSEMNGSSVDLVELPTTGTYTIFFDPLGTYTGSFTITVSSELSGEIVPQGSAVSIAISRSGQNARYTFSGTSGQAVSLQLSDVTIRSGYVSILKPDGNLLGQPTSFAHAGAVADAQVLPTSGTYAILIDPELSYTGHVKLALYNAPDLAGTIMTDQVAVTPTLTVPGQRALYTFNGTAGQWVNLGLTGVSIASSTVSMVKPDGSKLASTTIGPSGGSLDPATALPETGTYTIVVDPVGNHTGSMTLALSSPVTGTIAIDGTAVPVSLNKAGKTARYTFNGHAGQWVSLGLTAVGLTSSSISLMSPDGTTLASTAVGTAGGALEIPNPLPTTGTYTVLVRPGSTYTGNMTLTLSTEVSDSLKTNAAPRQIMISRPGQNGRYTFSGTANQQVTIKVTNNKLGNVTVNLYTPSGVLQAGATSSAASFNLNPVTLATTDTYTITINPAMTDTGSVHIQVTNP